MKLFYRPNGYYENLFLIDWVDIKKRGYDYVLVDADNTLFSHGKTSVDHKVFEFIRKVENLGLELILCSNAKLPRAKKIAESLQIDFVDSCRKPLPNKINTFLQEKKYDKEKVLIVGDQVFTDILLAKYLGISSILLKPLSFDEPLYIRVKRFFEKIYFNLADVKNFYDFD